jgi:hypothetical protein
MANYGIVNSSNTAGQVPQAISATYKSIVVTANSTAATGTYVGLRRGKIYDLLIGQAAVPADNYYEWDVCRCTYAASTAITTGGVLMLSSLSSTFALDGADAGAVAAITVNSTVETYLTAPTELWYIAINQRASYRWVAAPGSEMVYPANSSAAINGCALRARSSAGTGAVSATLYFQEQ